MTGKGSDIGVGLVSVGWMGRLHSRAYQALASVYPELGLRPRLVHAADRVAYARFQPGPGIGIGYDDLKVVEAKKFLVALAGGERRNATVEDAHAVAEVIAAADASAAGGAWQAIPRVPGATFGGEPPPAERPAGG
jgi:hypothetical protein